MRDKHVGHLADFVSVVCDISYLAPWLDVHEHRDGVLVLFYDFYR